MCADRRPLLHNCPKWFKIELMKAVTPLIADKELIRLWYEFYCLARQSEDAAIQRALKKTAKFYADWHVVDGLHFDDWWITHRLLFVDEHVVRVTDADSARTADNLYVTVPRGKSYGDMLEEFKALLERELPKTPKRRKLPTPHRYQVTEIQGVKRESLRMMLDLQKRVFSKDELKGVALRKRVLDFFSSERYKRKTNTVPKVFAVDPAHKDKDHADEADRNIRRYRQKAQKLMLNVASGQFPGKY